MNCKSLCVASMAVALVLGNVAMRPARADLTLEQQEALVQEYINLLNDLSSLERQLDDKNVQISQWRHGIDAMESSASGLELLLLFAYPPLTDAEKNTVNSQLDVLYSQIPHARLELDLYEATRDRLEAQISYVLANMALIAEILARY